MNHSPRLALAAVAAGLLAAAGLVIAGPAAPAAAATGFRVSGTKLLDARGNQFIMRGANHGHAWYTGQTQVWADMKNSGANTIRVVLTGGRYGYSSASDVSAVVSRCRSSKLVCVLENHDTTGYGDQGGATTLDAAANYWLAVKSALQGQEAYAIINIGNEPLGNNSASQWANATKSAVQKLRNGGLQHTLVVDAPNWGQDHQWIMRNNAASVLAADPLHNTVFSVHMYGVYDTAQEVYTYIDSYYNAGLPLIVGEFGHWHSDGPVDEDAIINHANYRGIGWLAWSWSGNGSGVEYLDMVYGFNVNSRAWWGDRIISGTNGWKQTSKQATVYN
ncbi:glycoside hydrolase family 5 protein [Dactylosporangium sp. NBC_01737]|uniref:cellulase family glycosylhydrolase n=1 Tax=Dactylosporangium sp. NBC_01737 TaxID=2975959 RepID=UPI002E12951B|nr:glycoside hydrolase family 5 protein [Dactylosporangium sp. NBC_01737]